MRINSWIFTIVIAQSDRRIDRQTNRNRKHFSARFENFKIINLKVFGNFYNSSAFLLLYATIFAFIKNMFSLVWLFISQWIKRTTTGMKLCIKQLVSRKCFIGYRNFKYKINWLYMNEYTIKCFWLVSKMLFSVDTFITGYGPFKLSINKVPRYFKKNMLGISINIYAPVLLTMVVCFMQKLL